MSVNKSLNPCIAFKGVLLLKYAVHGGFFCKKNHIFVGLAGTNKSGFSVN